MKFKLLIAPLTYLRPNHLMDFLAILFVFGVIMAGCAGAGTTAAPGQSAGSVSIPTPTVQTGTGSTASSDGTSKDLPKWMSTELRDVNSGQKFHLADFKGQTVLVETMAVWCTNCLAQQKEIQQFKSQAGDKVVSVSLDIDPNEDESILQKHASNHNFGWLYALAPGAVSTELSQKFSNNVLNPPTTPIILIDPKGEAHLLPFGIKSANQLAGFVKQYGGG
ncbi:MAG: TlpA family protein disulfide reductase [Chloroflexi bacterium]|nr:TlpA family protein disulfide reductase [Chloroflexota bacterium]